MVDAVRLILNDVMNEMAKSASEKGPLTTDKVRACLILSNEVSEASAEALKLTNPESKASHRKAVGTLEAMYHELVQVTNLSLMMMVNLKKEMGT